MEKTIDRSVRLLEKSLSYNPLTRSNVTSSRLIDREDDFIPLGAASQVPHPWQNTLDCLLAECMEVMQTNDAGALAMAQEMARCCSDSLNVLQNLRLQAPVGHGVSEEAFIEDEKNTWRLLYALYTERFHCQQQLGADQPPFVALNGVSDKQCVDALFQRDSLLRESQLIIDWLERAALDKDDAIMQYADFSDGWEHTKHQLMAPESIAIASQNEMIEFLQPDAPYTEGKRLHQLDEDNDRKLNKRVFYEIRCGSLERAQELLVKCGHPAKAAMLNGWKLFDHPCIESDPNEMEAALNTEGNFNRHLWKHVAWKFTEIDEIDLYQRAAVAVFAGRLDILLLVCQNWEDYLWAYMRIMVDVRVEAELRDHVEREYEKLPDAYWQQRTSLNEIFAILESCPRDAVREQSMQPYRIIQKEIILDNIAGLVDIIDRWIDGGRMHLDVHFCRFLVHLMLFLNQTSYTFNASTCDKVLKVYIDRLQNTGEISLLAYYVARLKRSEQVPTFARCVEHITEWSERQMALSAANDNNLDAMQVARQVVRNIQSRGVANANVAQQFTHAISDDDAFKVSALDWLLFHVDQRIDLLEQCNAMIFRFLTMGKVEAAQRAISRIPPETVDLLNQQQDRPAQPDDDRRTMIVRQHLCYKTYLAGQRLFNQWYEHFQGARPQKPDDLPSEGATFSDKVAHEHKMAQYGVETERWRTANRGLASAVKKQLYGVLLFPGGWLDNTPDAHYLRAVCIPQVVLLLYKILFELEEFIECIQLADLIASKKYCIYKVYTREGLCGILERLCDCSLELLKRKQDPWGGVAL